MEEIFDIFKTITQIPHCSKNADKLKDYIVDFAKEQGAAVEIDKAGNILCKKGMPKLCLQSHYDMVCLGEAPNIEIIEEEGYLKARNSTLGADNGIGVAMMLYFLKIHDNLECLFTADEEVGLIGADNLELQLSSKNILNLDSEEEGDIFIGCAGGVDIWGRLPVSKKLLENENYFYNVTVSGLPGGHSGVDIDKNIPNAIKELAYFLYENDVKIVALSGGEAINSIPKTAYALIASNSEIVSNSEYITLKKQDLDNSSFENYLWQGAEIVNLLHIFSNGVRAYDKELGIPKTSINLAKIETHGKSFKIFFFARSMENGELKRIKSETTAFLQSFGFEAGSEHEFPAWKPQINVLSEKVKEVSKRYFKDADYKAIHAGLECGIIQDKYKDINSVSIGPNIYFPHSTREKCEIESVKRAAKIVDEVIKEL